MRPITFTEKRLRALTSAEAIEVAAAFFSYAVWLGNREEADRRTGDGGRSLNTRKEIT